MGGYCNNTTFGVIGPEVPPEIFSSCSSEVRLDCSEPQLHHWGSADAPKGLFGFSESCDVFLGWRFNSRKGLQPPWDRTRVGSGETVGILVNMDERSMRMFRKGEQVIQIDGLPEVVYPVATPF